MEAVCDKLIETQLLDSRSYVQKFPLVTGSQSSRLCAISFDT